MSNEITNMTDTIIATVTRANATQPPVSVPWYDLYEAYILAAVFIILFTIVIIGIWKRGRTGSVKVAPVSKKHKVSGKNKKL